MKAERRRAKRRSRRREHELAFLWALAGVGFAIRPREIAALGWRSVVAAVLGWLVAAALLLAAVIASSNA